MPISSGQVAVGTAATLIDTTDVMPFELQIANNDNTDTVYIGGSAVTTSDGMTVQKLEHQLFRLSPGDRLYAISTKTGHTISYVKTTRDR
jgi:hypothetical protein